MDQPLASSSTSLSNTRTFRVSSLSNSSIRWPQITPVTSSALGFSVASAKNSTNVDLRARCDTMSSSEYPVSHVRTA